MRESFFFFINLGLMLSFYNPKNMGINVYFYGSL